MIEQVDECRGCGAALGADLAQGMDDRDADRTLGLFNASTNAGTAWGRPVRGTGRAGVASAGSLVVGDRG